MEIKTILEKIIKEKEQDGGIKSVVWLAAGGSNGGFFPVQYFMDREAREIRSQSFTSNEFVLAPPAFCNKNTLAVVCSMRGTPETCEAAQAAKDLGAATVGLYVNESRLTDICDYNIKYENISLDESNQAETNSGIALKLAMTLLHLTEGYEDYDAAMDGFELIPGIYRDAVEYCTPLARKWAQENKDEKTIYVMGSGPAYGAAYIFSVCNIMEMLQKASPTINSCEFFHGPFEILDKATPIFLLVSEGRVRKADERAVEFLKQYGGDKVYILDAKELGINRIKDSVCEYFNHLLFTPILNNVYMRQLSYATKVDYTTRRYMWKVKY
jgi:fructoselysine-6-P-deglycase FrlB-like protein